jgi:hypothetical protein
MGIDRALYKCIENWPLGRFKRAVLNGSNSRRIPVTRECHTDQLWAPCYFDIDELVCCKILKFADDTKLYSTVATEQEVAKLRGCSSNL